MSSPPPSSSAASADAATGAGAGEANARTGGPSLAPYFAIVAALTSSLGGLVALLPDLRDELGFSGIGIGVIVASGFGAALVAQIALSPQADRGRAPILLRGGLVLAIASLLLMAVGETLLVFTLARVALGAAIGMAVPAVRRTVVLADHQRRGANLGRLAAFDVGGFVVGPLVAGILADVWGLRAPFLAFAGVLVLLAPLVVRARPDTGRRNTDGGLGFDLLRIPQLQGALAIVAAYFFFIGTFEPVFVLQLQDRGATDLTIAAGLTAVAAPVALLAPIGGRMAQRVGPRRWTLALFSVVVAFTLAYGLVPGVYALLVASMMGGVAEGLGFAGTQLMISDAVPEERQAAALGLMGATEVGTAMIASLAGSLVYDQAGAFTTWTSVTVVMLALTVAGARRTRPVGPRPVTRWPVRPRRPGALRPTRRDR